jgi:hypothetical protein
MFIFLQILAFWCTGKYGTFTFTTLYCVVILYVFRAARVQLQEALHSSFWYELRALLAVGWLHEFIFNKRGDVHTKVTQRHFHVTIILQWKVISVTF